MSLVIQELNKLRLDLLDEAWVQGIYYSEFLEFGEFPVEYESVLEGLNVRSVFRGIMRAISDWLSEQSDEEKSWATLSHQVPHQKLLAILAYYIDLGTKNILNKEYRNNTLLVARLYYKFLSIPGYKAYHIYHSQLFTHSLECLSFPKEMCDNENNYYNIKELTCEVNTVIRELRMFVTDLKTIIRTLQLTPTDMNFEDILSNLVDITGGAIVNKLDADKIELANVSRVIYEIIDILLCDSNGDSNGVAIRLLFKCILPKLIAASVDSRNANNLIRASYVTYTGFLLTKYGKTALSGFTVLLEHLCYTPDGLERAEVRQARVSLVVGLMSLLPQKSYRNFVKWILQLSTTAKISHRQIALELLAKLLSNDPEDEPPQENVGLPIESSDTNKLDVDQNNSENPDEKKEEGSNEEALSENKSPPSPKDTVTTEDESSQDSQEPQEQEVTEEEVAGLLRQRAHTVPYGRVLRAVFERVSDVSSTLRTRALAVLHDCLQSDRPAMRRAVQELNGDGPVSRLMAAAARCVCDERAAVRRAALSLVLRSLTLPDAPPPQPTDLAILVSLCRDASIVVRGGAVAALGELAARRPARRVLDAFLAGPLHQLCDPEAKIQEQVGQLVQQLLIDRIQKYSPLAEEEVTPWLLLAAVARHNKRRHLQKACALLAKAGGGVTHRLVDIVSTHLAAKDEERDLQCLVLLTSAARHLDYGDVGFVLDYYYRLTDDTQTHDVRLLALTVELLSTWSRFLGTEERTALRDHIVRRLAAGIDDGCRIASASLAAQLDPHNLHWATELMQLSERRALAGTEVEEWVRAADLSLVAPAPPAPALLPLLLAALAAPPAEWSAAEWGACVAACGRLCVRSRGAAAAAAPPLAALLAAAAPLPVRHNALLALTDICVRYTCIVEPLLGAVRGCVRATAPAALRRAAARALTRLLLAGYLRLRTPLYYTYCALLADEDHDVREPAEYYVTRCLAPDAIYHHFVDCVMHYNNCDDTEESLSFDARQLIYDVMLQRLSIVQRLNLQCRLAREVLGHAADMTDEGDGELSPALNAALLDTITLLCGPRMKLPKKPQRDGEADIDDLQERITTNIVSHKMKRTVAEVVVPAVLRLYARLGARGGQRAAYLVRIATDLLADYRHEIEELIENDEELVEKVRHFQETIGIEPSFGNARNLVTASTAHEPETPRAPRRRPRAPRTPRTPRGPHAPHARSPPRKRALRI